jgi:hypothetical protein
MSPWEIQQSVNDVATANTTVSGFTWRGQRLPSDYVDVRNILPSIFLGESGDAIRDFSFAFAVPYLEVRQFRHVATEHVSLSYAIRSLVLDGIKSLAEGLEDVPAAPLVADPQIVDINRLNEITSVGSREVDDLSRWTARLHGWDEDE